MAIYIREKMLELLELALVQTHIAQNKTAFWPSRCS